MSQHEGSLKEKFRDATKYQEALEDLDPRSADFKQTQNLAIEALEESRDLISKTALYSTNEDVDDISTKDLQYLSVDYLLAELLLKSYGTDRLGQLTRAAELLEAFLTRVDHYDLLSKPDSRLLDRYREQRKTFAIVSTSNAEERRNIKVARFQQEKELKNKLKLLRNQSNGNHVDEEVRRSLYLAEIALNIHNTFQSLDMIAQELSILSQMSQVEPVRTAAPTDDNRDRTRANNGYSERLDGPRTMGGLGRRGGPLLDSKGKPLQPFTLMDKRTQLQQGVFRPGHNLPTMSIDEYLEEERKRGGIIEGGGNSTGSQVELDEDNMDLVDAATYKAREWDEFVEANPKGAGNTVNRG